MYISEINMDKRIDRNGLWIKLNPSLLRMKAGIMTWKGSYHNTNDFYQVVWIMGVCKVKVTLGPQSNLLKSKNPLYERVFRMEARGVEPLSEDNDT